MKKEYVSVFVLGLSLATACSSGSSSSGNSSEGGATASSSGSSGTGSSSGSGGGSSGGSSSGGSGDDGSDGVGVDCTTTPCATKGLVCCPSVNQCTPPDSMICSSPVWVACTRQSDCSSGQVCCVTAATTTGSGPSGSECRTACISTDQGPACNIMDPNRGLGDCPSPASDWLECVQVSNSPASLGECIGKTSSDAGMDAATKEAKDAAVKDAEPKG